MNSYHYNIRVFTSLTNIKAILIAVVSLSIPLGHMQYHIKCKMFCRFFSQPLIGSPQVFLKTNMAGKYLHGER